METQDIPITTSSTSAVTVHLNDDIFDLIIDLIIDNMKHLNGAILKGFRKIDVLSTGRSLRLVCRHADVRLHAYLSPDLELLSSQHAARVWLTGIPNIASIRSLIIHAGVKMVYITSILYALQAAQFTPSAVFRTVRFSNVNKLVLRCQDGIPIASLILTDRRPSLRQVVEEVRDLAYVIDRSEREIDFHRTIGSSAFVVERLALHMLKPWPLPDRYYLLRVLTLLWMPTSNDMEDLAKLLTKHGPLQRVTFIWPPWEDANRADTIPVTSPQKVEFAQRIPNVAIAEVHPAVGKEHMAAWFAERVQDDRIWDLEEAINWLDL